MTDFVVVPVDTERDRVGESAVWSVRDACLYSVDVWGAMVRRRPLAAPGAAFAMPEMAAAVVPASSGVVVGLESMLVTLDPATGAIASLGAPPGHPGTHRFNDAVIDAAGNLLIGTMRKSGLGAAPTGVLHRFAQGRWQVLDTGFWTINGLACSPDGRSLYYSDSHPSVRCIWARDYDPANGALGPRRLFADLRHHAGRPDGAAVDADGNYWIAGVGGGVVYGFDPGGAALAEIPLPVENPTRVAFGGPGLTTLYVTSMAERLSRPDPDGLAGATLALPVGRRGLASHELKLDRGAVG